MDTPSSDSDDKRLEKLTSDLLSQLNLKRIQPDFSGEYFSNKTLNDQREVLESKGFEIAINFQISRVSPKDNKWNRMKSEILLDFLEKLKDLKFDIITSAFIIGKLNPNLSQLKEKH